MLRDYIYDTKFQLFIFDSYINVLNYIEIISFTDSKIIIKCPSYNLVINGFDLIISKMMECELLIKGKLKQIEFR